MITKIYRKHLISLSFIICHLSFSMMLASCAENANEWSVDESYSRLFRTTNLSLVETQPTAVVLSFNGVTSATQYVLEFSLDSLQFNEIVRTEVIKADTLTPYSTGKVMVQNEYHKLIDNLYGTTTYSVRLKAVNDATGDESGWYGVSFKTPAEQIFTNVTPGIKDVQLYWNPDKTASAIKLGTLSGKDTTWVSTLSITADMQRQGKGTIDGLSPGTNYIAQIFNDTFLRGTYKFKTLGSATGQTIDVAVGDDVNELLAAATDETVTLIFEGGNEYEVGKVSLPETVKNIYFSGKMVDDQRPVLKMTGFAINAKTNNINFQYVDIDDEMKNAYWFDMRLDDGYDNVTFQGCIIRNIPRTLVYINNANVQINDIIIDNCIINNVGTSGYGMINIGKAGGINTISITNSTLIEIGDQMMDLRGQANLFKVDKVTFCNYTTKLQKWILVQKTPKEVQVTNMIFCGPNGEQKMNSGYGDYSGWLDFSGCYLTADFPENSKKFFNAIRLEQTTEQLFVDPQNGDFHLKPGVVFKGKGVAGDPRWW